MMTTPVHKSSAVYDSQMRAQDAPQKRLEAASEAQQRFKQLLAALKGRQPACSKTEEEAALETLNVPPPAPVSPLPIGVEIDTVENARGVASVSGLNHIQADINTALHALTAAMCSPAAPADPQSNPASNERVALRVDVLSGPLTGAQMVVAAQQCKLQMTVRAANRDQSAALEAIRSTLVGKVRSLDQFDIQFEPEGDVNG